MIISNIIAEHKKFNDNWVSKINSSKIKRKLEFKEKLADNSAESFVDIIEDKLVESLRFSLTTARQIDSSGVPVQLAFVNTNDPLLTTLPEQENFGSSEDNQSIQLLSGLSQPSQKYLVGKISFKGVNLTEDQAKRNGEDTSGTGNKGLLALTPLSKTQIQKVLIEAKEALSGKKGAVTLLTTALNIYSMREIAKDAIHEDLIPDGLTLESYAELLISDAISKIEGFEDLLSIENLKEVAAEALTDPANLALLLIKVLSPGVGWAATAYEVIDNFDYIKASIELAWYAFDDPASAFGDAIDEINSALDTAIDWAEWIAPFLGLEPNSDGEYSLDDVQEGLPHVREQISALAPEIASFADNAPDFDGFLQIAPPFNDADVPNNHLDVDTYLEELLEIRREFSSGQQAEFGTLPENFALLGGAEDDTLTGGFGNDVMVGGAGSDVFFATAGNDYIIGGDGNDDVDVINYAFIDSLVGLDEDGNEIGLNNERLLLFTGQSNEAPIQVRKHWSDGNVQTDRLTQVEEISLSSARDEVAFVNPTGQDVTIIGGDEPNPDQGDLVSFEFSESAAFLTPDSAEQFREFEVFIGSSGSDYIYHPQDGHVALDGRGGSDTLIGGDGADVLYGGGDWGDDVLLGGAGDDLLTYYAGEDLLFGGEGNDYYDFSNAIKGNAKILLDGDFGHDEISSHEFQDGDPRAYISDLSSDDFTGGVLSDAIYAIHSLNIAFAHSEDRGILSFSSNDLSFDLIDFVGGAHSNVSKISIYNKSETYVALSGDAILTDNITGSSILVPDVSVTILKETYFRNTSGGIVIDNENYYSKIYSSFYLKTNRLAESQFYSRVGWSEYFGNLAELVDPYDPALGSSSVDFESLSFGGPLVSDDGFDGNNDSSEQLGSNSSSASSATEGGRISALVSHKTQRFAGNDTFWATDDSDSFEGWGGDDVLFGHVGNDSLSGGAGNDSLFGGIGDDTLAGGSGSDTLLAGAGDDLIFFQGGEEFIDGGSGNDTLDLKGYYGGVNLDLSGESLVADNAETSSVVGVEHVVSGSFSDSVLGTSGSNTIFTGDGDDSVHAGDGDDYVASGYGIDSSDGGAGIDTLDVSHNTGSVETDLSAGWVFWSDGNEVAVNFENYVGVQGDDTVHGTDVSNTLSTGNGDDIAFGLDGDDVLYGGYGEDALYAGSGNDYAFGFIGNDILYGAAGDDSLFGDVGDDTHFGEAGSDSISGWHGDDILYGGTDDDVLEGGAGSDTLIGGSGSDTLSGGEGADVFRYISRQDSSANGDGEDLILDFVSGSDAIDLSGLGFSYLVRDGATEEHELRVSYNASTNTTLLDSDQSDFRLLLAGNHYASLRGSDVLFADLEQLTLLGDGSNDTIESSILSQYVDGFGGNDTLLGNYGDDTLNGSDGNDTAFGGHGYDSVFGGPGDDIIGGFEGDDTLFGGDGNDSIDGGDGNDYIHTGFGLDTVDGGLGVDTLDISHVSEGALVDLATGVLGWESSPEEVARNFENVVGTLGDNSIIGTDGVNVLHAREGNDAIFGADGNDSLHGEKGNDVLYGGQGNDLADGGIGEDTLFGGNGDDDLRGGVGNDFQYGGDGNDTVIAGDGDDTVVGGAGRDHLDGEKGVDWLVGGHGEDFLHGGSGVDRLFGGDQDDSVYSGEGADLVFGGAGSDHLVDHLSQDQIYGGDGDDLIGFGWISSDNDPVDTEIFGGGGNDRIFSRNRVAVYGGDDDDLIDTIGTDETVFGGAGNDVLVSKGGSNIIYGGAGDDVFGTGVSPYDNENVDDQDHIFGGAGNDTVNGENRSDSISGGSGDDVIYSGGGSNEISGDAGDDLIVASYRAATIFGGDGDDVIHHGRGRVYGGDGSDRLIQEANGVTVSGGSGSDIFVVRTAEHSIIIDDFAPEEDFVDISALIDGNPGELADQISTLYFPDSNSTIASIVTSGSGVNFLIGFTGVLWDLDVTNFIGGLGFDPEVNGTDSSEQLFGSHAADYLFGGSGNDIIFGGVGADHMYGGIGNDHYFVESPFDVIVENENSGERDTVTTETNFTLPQNVENVVVNGENSIRVRGNEHDNSFIANDYGNTFYADAGNDTISGGNGHDFFLGGVGGDTISGGNGDDFISGGDGIDTLDGGAGNDTLDFSYSGSSFRTDLAAGETYWSGLEPDGSQSGELTLSSASDTGALGENQLPGLTASQSLEVTISFENVIGSSGDNEILGTDGSNSISALDGDDLIRGRAGGDWIAAGSGVDNVFGDEGNDTISGDGGDDIVYGGVGGDQIDGGDGADILFGDEGNDVLDGGVNDDTLSGGTGNDTFRGGSGNDTILAGDGNDFIIASADFDIIFGGEGIDTFDGSFANRVNFDLVSNTVSFPDFGKSLEIYEVENIIGNSKDNSIIGDGVSNTLFGHSGDDSIGAGGGDDIVYGGEGADTIDGAAGADLLYGGVGDDVFRLNLDQIADVGFDAYFGDTGTNTLDLSESSVTGEIDLLSQIISVGSLSGNATFDNINRILLGDAGQTIIADDIDTSLFGGAGEDRLHGGDGADEVSGSAGNDWLEGGSSTDSLFGGIGNDFLYGGDGNDLLDGGDGTNHVFGGGGDDYLIASGHIDNEYFGGEEFDVIDLREFSSADVGVDFHLFFSIEGLVGSAGHDTLYGDSEANLLVGGAGNDNLFGGDGSDELNGGDGLNKLYGGAGDDRISISGDFESRYFGGSGFDIADFSLRSDNVNIDISFHGFDRIEGIIGTSGNNTINGSAQANSLDGHAGNDFIYGWDGNDTIDGGDGDDNHYGGAGNDRIAGSLGTDYFDGGTGFDTLDFSYSESEVFIDLTAESVLFASGFEEQAINFEAVIASNGNSILHGTSVGNQLIGLAGNDILEGKGGNDTLEGGAGEDNLFGGAEHDLLFGGSGNDTLTGDAGEDVFFGGAGSDTYYGGEGIDTVDFSQELIGLVVHMGQPTESSENAYGDSFISIEQIIGTALNDQITGTFAANETLFGGDGNDELDGDDGDDILSGDNGNDELTGGAGSDVLSGGSGMDIFTFELNSGNDTITDFDTVDELIDLRPTRVHFDELTISGVGNDALIEFDTSAGGVKITLQGVDAAEIGETNFLIRQDGTAGNDTLWGTEGDDELYGGAGDDYLSSFGGNDLLNGRTGNDTLIGGEGNDRYYIDAAGDLVVEDPHEGIDYVYATVPVVLSPNVEYGAANGGNRSNFEFHVTGNDSDNWITGNEAANSLDGGDGRDRIIGYEGDDTIIGGKDRDVLEGGTEADAERDSGTDTFVFLSGDSVDIILDFETNRDFIDISAVEIPFVDVVIGIYSGGTSIGYDPGAIDTGTIFLPDIDPTSLSFANFITFHGSLQPAIEGGDGNDDLRGSIADDLLIGYEGNDELTGYAGTDEMRGGHGDDRYFVYDVNDAVIESAGEGEFDKVTTYVSFTLPDHVEWISAAGDGGAIDLTGNDLNNRVVGNGEANILRGGAGYDRIWGKDGADTFVFGLGEGASDRIEDFDASQGDLISIEVAGVGFADLILTNTSNGTTVQYDATDAVNNKFLLVGIELSDVQESHFMFV